MAEPAAPTAAERRIRMMVGIKDAVGDYTEAADDTGRLRAWSKFTWALQSGEEVNASDVIQTPLLTLTNWEDNSKKVWNGKARDKLLTNVRTLIPIFATMIAKQIKILQIPSGVELKVAIRKLYADSEPAPHVTSQYRNASIVAAECICEALREAVLAALADDPAYATFEIADEIDASRKNLVQFRLAKAHHADEPTPRHNANVESQHNAQPQDATPNPFELLSDSANGDIHPTRKGKHKIQWKPGNHLFTPNTYEQSRDNRRAPGQRGRRRHANREEPTEINAALPLAKNLSTFTGASLQDSTELLKAYNMDIGRAASAFYERQERDLSPPGGHPVDSPTPEEQWPVRPPKGSAKADATIKRTMSNQTVRILQRPPSRGPIVDPATLRAIENKLMTTDAIPLRTTTIPTTEKRKQTANMATQTELAQETTAILNRAQSQIKNLVTSMMIWWPRLKRCITLLAREYKTVGYVLAAFLLGIAWRSRKRQGL